MIRVAAALGIGLLAGAIYAAWPLIRRERAWKELRREQDARRRWTMER